MRAIALILLCIVMLAMMQASYLVVEAKKHELHDARITDDADRADDWKAGKHSKKEHAHKDDKKKQEEDPAVPPVVNDLKVKDADVSNKDAENDIYNQMAGDEPQRRRERVDREERRNRKANKMTPEEREAHKQEKAAAKAAREERKKAKAERKSQKKTKVECTTEDQCQEGECCMPSRRGEHKYCKVNSRPRAAGDGCMTSCSCEGELNCYTSALAPTNKRGKPKKKSGKCKAAAESGDTMLN